MILLALLSLAAQDVSAPPVAEDEIVVIGKRLSEISVIVGRDARGKFTCGLNKSSGNAKLDGDLCKTAAKCVRQGASDGAKVQACVDRRKPELLAGVRKALAS